jgi:hypothetical protein
MCMPGGDPAVMLHTSCPAVEVFAAANACFVFWDSWSVVRMASLSISRGFRANPAGVSVSGGGGITSGYFHH